MNTAFHPVCEHSGCVLSRFLMLTQFPAPKFHIGQRVILPWFCEDDGELIEDEGMIVGLYYCPHEPPYGWVYWVAWDVLPKTEHLDLPHYEDTPEDGLRASDESSVLVQSFSHNLKSATE
jgi:hypothetical protein